MTVDVVSSAKASPVKNEKKQVKKKQARKKATKKGAPKKKVTKRQQRETTRKNASPDQVFVLVNGHKVKNVKELADVIEKIEDYVFHHHVNQDKHDFAVWLKDVFGEVALAEELANAKDKNHVQLVLYKHISHKLW